MQLFVNSLDREGQTEEFTTPGKLSSWLAEHRVTSRLIQVRKADLQRALDFREALRDLALANNGVPLTKAAATRINRHFMKAPLVARVRDGDVPTLEPAGRGINEALGHIAGVVVTEALAGRWQRLKACAREECHWVFFDHSKSQTGRWCTMSICGARTKMKSYYRRRRSSPRRHRRVTGT